MSDRGIKKWAPYKSLVEHTDTLDRARHNRDKVEKPIISSEEAEDINNILVNYHGEELTIEYYRNERIIKEDIIIKRIDTYEKKLVLLTGKTIKLSEIVSLTIK